MWLLEKVCLMLTIYLLATTKLLVSLRYRPIISVQIRLVAKGQYFLA